MPVLDSQTSVFSIPQTMQAAVYRGVEDVRVETVPVPAIGRGEVLLRVEACGICGTDLKKIHTGSHAAPRVFGHETAGTVVAVGEDVSGFAPGDRAMVFHHIPCGRCYYCRKKTFAQCPVYKKVGVTAAYEPSGGGFAEYVRVMDWIAERGLVRIPDDIPFEQAAFIEPVNTCLKAVRSLALEPDETVLVIGQGPIGIILAALAARTGAKVLTSDLHPERHAAAAEFGLKYPIDAVREDVAARARAESEGRGADAVILAVAGDPLIRLAMDAARPGGRVLLFAQTQHGEAPIDPAAVCMDEKSLLGSYSASVDIQEEGAALVFDGYRHGFDLTRLISHRFSLAQAVEAIHIASNPGPDSLKIFINPTFGKPLLMASGLMQAAVLYGREDLRLELLPRPRAGAGELVLRVGAALTCGTDLKVFRRGYHARMLQPPVPFGHEVAGTVEEAGPGAPFRPGDRVVALNSAPCGVCFFCRDHQPNLCDDLLFNNGAYAEYLRVPARIAEKNTLAVPDAMPLEHAALCEPLACVLLGLQESGVRLGDTVAVIGAGPIGLLFVHAAALAGARVLAVVKHPAQAEDARALGAAETVIISADGRSPAAEIRALTDGRGADVAIEAVASPVTWGWAVDMARKGGTVNFFGGPPAGTQVALDTNQLHYSGLTLRASFHHTPATVRRAFALLASGRFQAQHFLTGRLGLAEVPELYRAMSRQRDDGIKPAPHLDAARSIKTVILP